MTVLQIVSDLHLNCNPNIELSEIIKPAGDILLIAGDVGSIDCIDYCFSYVSKNFEHVFYVSGNHEYYGCKDMDEIDVQLQKICDKYTNITFLNKKAKEYNGYVFIGTTLWANPKSDEMKHIDLGLKLRKIRINNKIINSEKLNEIFDSNLSWLEKKLVKYKNKKVIVITHHLPSYQLIPKEFRKIYRMNSAFATDLEYLFKKPVKLWVCGHTHFSENIKINSIPMIINPFGFPKQRGISGYNNSLTVKLKNEIILAKL
jgi:Icc-related predicted phosphoesterase